MGIGVDMISLSLNEAINKSPRKTTAMVMFELAAPEAKEHAVAITPPGNLFSKPDNIINNITNISHPIATFESNYWRLDGSFRLPVRPEEAEYEVGFWSEKISDENGVFSNPIIIEIIFNIAQDVPVVGISFDKPTNNFARNIQVQMFNTLGSVIYSETETNNNFPYFQTENGAVNVRRIVITLNHTNNSFRFMRVAEINFGELLIFDGSDLTGLSCVVEGDPSGKKFIMNQLKLAILNKERFNLFNPNSPARYLQQRQSLEYYHGVFLNDTNIEWVYCGNYYLKKWDVSDRTVSFTAHGKVSLEGETTYFGSSLERFTVGQMIVNIIGELGLEYLFPLDLLESPAFPNYFGEISYRKVLAMLSELSCCISYENRQNIILFVDIDTTDSVRGKINYKNLLKVPKITFDTYFNGIMLREYTVIQTDPELRFESEEIFYPAPWMEPNDPEIPYVVDLPMMIRGIGFEELRDWFLNRRFEVLANRLDADVNWWQNPSLTGAETLLLQADRQGHILEMLAYGHTLNFKNGALRGSTKLIGRPPEVVWNYTLDGNWKLGELPFMSFRQRRRGE